RLQHLNGLGLDPTQKLVEQSRFAHARIAHEYGNCALTIDGPAVDFGEKLELSIAARERCQPALFRHLQPGAAAELPAHGICANRLSLSFDLKLTEVIEHEEPVPKVLSSSTGYDLAWCGDSEQPGGEVGRVADRRVVHTQIVANGADDHRTGIDADPHAEFDAVSSLDILGKRLESILYCEPRTERALSVVLVRDRRPEERHHPVAEELVDRALVIVNRIEDHLEDAVHDRVDVFGIELLGDRRKSRHV